MIFNVPGAHAIRCPSIIHADKLALLTRNMHTWVYQTCLSFPARCASYYYIPTSYHWRRHAKKRSAGTIGLSLGFQYLHRFQSQEERLQSTPRYPRKHVNILNIDDRSHFWATLPVTSSLTYPCVDLEKNSLDLRDAILIAGTGRR